MSKHLNKKKKNTETFIIIIIIIILRETDFIKENPGT